jgi:serine/threonine protein kinase
LAGLRAARHRLLPELERMLEARERVASDGFLEALPILDLNEEPASGWREGDRMGAYRLLRQIGAGGMAEVWLGERADGAFARRVAVKLPYEHPSPARRASFVERFRRERDILASLDHPNIARLHDAGVTDTGQPWLAIEYVEGETITAWCDAHRLDLESRVRVFRQVLLAVQHAHSSLVLHRDLKPGNILVTHQGEVRLLDFGIAKLVEVEGEALDDTALTRQAGRLLTLQYASPEQIEGVGLTTACDVYSLGVVLYELLCGERPYELARPSAAALEEAIVHTDPRPPGSRTPSSELAQARSTTPARLKKTLAGDLGAVALRALAKAPADRYPSAESLSADLERWLSGLPVEATSPTAWDRTISFVRRHAAATSLASAALVGIVVAGGTAAYQATRAHSEADRAVAARDFVLDLLKSADPNVAHDGPRTLKDVLAEGVPRSAERFASDAKGRAEILEQIAQVQTRMGEHADAERTLSVAVKLLHGSGDDSRWAGAQIELAELHIRLGSLATAHHLLDSVEPVVGKATATHELLSRYHEVRGRALRNDSDLDAALKEMQRALAEARLVENDPAPRVVDVLRALAEVESEQNQAESAIAHIDEAAAWTDKSPHAFLVDVIGIAMDQSRIRYLAGEYLAASEIAASNLPRCKRLFGEFNEQCVLLLDQQAKLLLVLGNVDSAAALLPALRKARAELSSSVRKAQVLLTAARVGAASRQMDDDDVLSAVRHIAEPGPETTLPPSYPLYADLVLAEVALRQGDPAESLRWVNHFEQRQLAPSAPHPFRLRSRVLRGIALARQGDPEDAIATLRSAAAESEVVLGQRHTLTLLYRLNQLPPLLSLGRNAEVDALLATTLPSLRNRLGATSPVVRRAEELGSNAGPPRGDAATDLFL